MLRSMHVRFTSKPNQSYGRICGRAGRWDGKSGEGLAAKARGGRA